MTPPPHSPLSPGAPSVKRKTSPVVWILVAVLGLFLLGFIGLLGTGLFIARNPGLVIGKLITASNPDAEVVSTDNGAKTIIIRNRKTGEEVTMSYDDVKNGRFKVTGIGKDGEVGNIEFGGGAGKMPSWVPAYPGATAKGNVTARGDDGTARGAGGIVTFESSDAPAKVVDYYKDRLAAMGMKTVTAFDSPDGGMMTAHGDDGRRTLQITVSKGSGGGSTIGVAYGEKR
jgi:hypothetical protein